MDFHEVTRFTPQSTAAVFGVQLEKTYVSSNQEFQDAELHQYDADVYDVLGAAMDAYRRTKKDVFHDATVSLLFALQFDVHVDEMEGGPSRESRLEAFSKWVDLLYWTLPSSWKVNTLINDLRTNNRIEELSNVIITNTVESNKDVVLNDPSVLWTDSCQRRSRKSEGYTCGLWSLFHIISIGVVEQHHHVIGDTEMISTQVVAETFRDYINNFLGCKVCKKKFNQLYKKSCGKLSTGCDRFKKKKRRGKRVDPRKNPDVEYWRDFTIWVWEIHNAINLEVLRERKKTTNEGKPTKEEEAKIMYPSVKNCPKCRPKSGGDWDKTEVYTYLKSQYWPEGVHNFRYVVLKSKKENLKVQNAQKVIDFETRWQMLGLFLSLALTVGSRYYKKVQKSKTGKHKKKDVKSKSDKSVLQKGTEIKDSDHKKKDVKSKIKR